LIVKEKQMDFIQRLITALTETHPVHPMLVHFPIAFTASGALFILLALWKRKMLFDQMAFANLVLAALGTLAAAASGIYDNNLNYLGEAPNAKVKIILGVILFLTTTGTALWRWKNEDLIGRRPARVVYVLAYLASFAIALVLAFLGGVIVYGF
jgi:uncharacterized membrane protein